MTDSVIVSCILYLVSRCVVYNFQAESVERTSSAVLTAAVYVSLTSVTASVIVSTRVKTRINVVILGCILITI